MLIAVLLAVAAAIVLGVLGALLRRPREWALRQSRRIRDALSPGRHEAIQLAIEPIAAELTAQGCARDGNPDDEYRDDVYRWFTGDPEANVDYSRRQQRDLDRLGVG